MPPRPTSRMWWRHDHASTARSTRTHGSMWSNTMCLPAVVRVFEAGEQLGAPTLSRGGRPARAASARRRRACRGTDAAPFASAVARRRPRRRHRGSRAEPHARRCAPGRARHAGRMCCRGAPALDDGARQIFRSHHSTSPPAAGSQRNTSSGVRLVPSASATRLRMNPRARSRASSTSSLSSFVFPPHACACATGGELDVRDVDVAQPRIARFAAQDRFDLFSKDVLQANAPFRSAHFLTRASPLMNGLRGAANVGCWATCAVLRRGGNEGLTARIDGARRAIGCLLVG